MLAASLLLLGALVSAARADPAPSGEQVYKDGRCFACHGGLGQGGAGPSFRGNQYLSFDEYVAGKILLGRGIMPAFSEQLSDDQIAAVGSYIRNSWGNHYGEVAPGRVSEVRKEIIPQPKTPGTAP